MQRITIPALTERTLREVLANALIHRDYFDMAEMRVEISEATLEVTNPGGLPRSITLANIVSESRPRSSCLAEVFRRAGLVDRVGRGVRVMFAERLDAAMPPPEYAASSNSTVRVQFALTPPHEGFYHFRRTFERHERALTLEEKLLMCSLTPHARSLLNFTQSPISGEGLVQEIINFTQQNGRITRGNVVDMFQVSPQTATRELQALREQGMLVQRGEKRGTHYILSEPS